MAYITKAELEARVPALKVGILANDQGADEANTAIVAEAIADAEGIIDSFLKSRYTVPLTNPVPQVIERIDADLATYFLYTRKYPEEMPPAMVERYNAALALLKAIADGRIVLDIDAGSYSTGMSINKSASDRSFTDDVLSKY